MKHRPTYRKPTSNGAGAMLFCVAVFAAMLVSVVVINTVYGI